MPAWICVTCGVQYPDTPRPPESCPICLDERQYVGWDGQRWTMRDELLRDHASELREEEPDLLGVGVTPAVATTSSPGLELPLPPTSRKQP